MNGFATLLAPVGGTPEVLGMAGRSPGSGQTQTDSDGFLGILQQMIGGSAQMASLLAMLPVQAALSTDTGGTTSPVASGEGGNPLVITADGSATTEQPADLSALSSSSAGLSPPELKDAVPLTPALMEDLTAVAEGESGPSDAKATTTQQQLTTAAKAVPTPAQTGALQLPPELLATATEDPALSQEFQKLIDTPTVTPVNNAQAVVSGEDTGTMKQVVSSPSSRQSAPRPAPKTTQAGRLSSLMHPDKPAAGQLAGGKRMKSDEDATRVAQQSTDNQPAVEEQTIRVANSSVDQTQVEQASGGAATVTSTAANEQVPPEAQPDNAAVVPAKAEEMPAKAVVAAKPVLEAQLHDDGTSKSGFTHAQTQIGAVKVSTTHPEVTAQKLSDFLSTLPPATARSVFDQVVTGAALQVRGDTSEMRIKLVPESLGEVTLNVRMEGGQMTAQIDVSHAAVKAALESNMPQLREALSSHGIEVQRLDVFQHGQSTTKDTGGEQSNRYPRQNARHNTYVTDAIDQIDTGRMMGYNTIEVVM
jgi:flagellar hook-length control protein FliK